MSDRLNKRIAEQLAKRWEKTQTGAEITVQGTFEPNGVWNTFFPNDPPPPPSVKITTESGLELYGVAVQKDGKTYVVLDIDGEDHWLEVVPSDDSR